MWLTATQQNQQKQSSMLGWLRSNKKKKTSKQTEAIQFSARKNWKKIIIKKRDVWVSKPPTWLLPNIVKIKQIDYGMAKTRNYSQAWKPNKQNSMAERGSKEKRREKEEWREEREKEKGWRDQTGEKRFYAWNGSS